MEQQLADLPGEKWVDIRFEEKYSNNYYIQISNYGRIKTFTKNCKGRLINGCIQFGYRTLKLNLYVPRDPITERKFKFIGAEVVKLRLKIEKMNRQLAKKTIPEDSMPSFRTELDQLEKLYKKVYQN
ncbi:MAG: hypothetical protein K2Q22_14320, partial [Cytophagales bacterium]|nr:hypothetical protein [Cytophagales bacterium]